MLKNGFILLVVLLIVSIVPVSAAKMSEVLNNGNNIDEKLSTINTNSNEIKKVEDEITKHAANINDSANYIKDNWWKFWQWSEVSKHISTINSESKQLEANATDIQNKAQIITENSEEQVNQGNNSYEDAQSMAKQLKDHFKIAFNIFKTSPSELKSGDIVQLETEKGYYRYLIFDKIDKENGFALFNGSNGKVNQIHVEQLPSLVKLKLTPNNPDFDSSQAVTQIYSIQKENIGQKLDEAENTEYTAHILNIIAVSLMGLAVILAIIDAILWILVIVTAGASAVPAGLVAVAGWLVCAAATGLFASAGILYENAKEMKSSAETELTDLNSYHSGKVNHAPVAGNSTVNTESGMEVQGVFNVTDVDGDNLTSDVVVQPEHGIVNILANGSFSYKSEKDFFGNDTFSYRAKDSKGLYSNDGFVTIAVKENGTLNVTAQNLTVDAFRNTPVTININTTGINSSYDVVIIQNPLNGNVSVLNQETMNFPQVQYIPFNDFTGNDTFSYQLSYNGRTSNIAWINVVVKDNIFNPFQQIINKL